MNLRLKQTPGIYLLGFMASGKSTVGRHLAHRLGWNFFDLDDEIEAAEQTAIAHIFDTRGEAEFRRIESEMLAQHVRSIEHGRAAVVALGGGAFLSPANRELASANGVSVWLDCDFERIARRGQFAFARGTLGQVLRHALILLQEPRDLRGFLLSAGAELLQVAPKRL